MNYAVVLHVYSPDLTVTDQQENVCERAHNCRQGDVTKGREPTLGQWASWSPL